MACISLFGAAILSVSVSVSVSANAADTVSPHAFTEAFATAATAAMPSAKVTVKGDLWLETRDAGGNATTTDLHNAYAVYRAHPTDLDSVVRGYVAVLADSVSLNGTAPPVDRSRIVPVLKPRVWAETVQRQRGATPATQLLTEPFTDELTIVYAEDRPSSIRFLMTRDDVGHHNGLRALALRNLSRLMTKIEIHQASDGVFLVSAGGSYEASLLLVDSLWSSDQIKVDGDIVVAAPAKDAVLVRGTRNAAGIAHLRAYAAHLTTSPYGLTAVLYAYRGGRFVRLED